MTSAVLAQKCVLGVSVESAVNKMPLELQEVEMKSRKGIVLLMACFMFAALGCEESSKLSAPNCGNGMIDWDEVCDGTQFAEGAKVCPSGMELVDASKFACTEMCELDVSSACKLVGCGDGKLADDEVCDGTQFAEGAKVCPPGMELVDESKFACNALCQVDFTAACRVPSCGDGQINGSEVCDGTQFAEGAKVCPDGFKLIDESKFACSQTCQVEFLDACMMEDSHCGDGIISGYEMCDGDIFRTEPECPEGYKRIDGRDFACSECAVNTKMACYKGDESAPLLYFSEIRMIPEDYFEEVEYGAEGKKADLVVIEIANLGAETSLEDCSVVGLQLKEGDNSSLASDYLFEIALNHVQLGNSTVDKEHVYTLCGASQNWMPDVLKEAEFIDSDVCRYYEADQYKMKEDCQADCRKLSSDQVEECMGGCQSDDLVRTRHIAQCYKYAYANELNRACRQFNTDGHLSLTAMGYNPHKGTEYQSEIYGLGLKCGGVFYDVMRYDSLYQGMRVCSNHDIKTIVPTGFKVIESETDADKATWRFTHDYYDNHSMGMAICGEHVGKVN